MSGCLSSFTWTLVWFLKFEAYKVIKGSLMVEERTVKNLNGLSVLWLLTHVPQNKKLSVWETLRFLWTWTPHWVIFQHPFSTHSFSWCRGENCTRVPKRIASYIITHLTSIGVIYYAARDFERDWGWRYDGYALVRWPGRMFLEICRRLNCRFYSCVNNFKKFHYGFFFDFNFQNSLYFY